MRHRALGTLAAGAALAASLAPSAWAPERLARIDLSTSFDRQTVLPGQVVVAEITLQNRGPDAARGIVLEARLVGATVLRARASSGRCGPVLTDGVVRCTFRSLGIGTGPQVVVQGLADRDATAVRVSARVAGRATRDPEEDDDAGGASITVRPGATGITAVVSFVLQAPATVVAGRAFSAVLRLLNRGPGPTIVTPVRVTPEPVVPILLSPVPRRLEAGEERTVFARITPARPGRLALKVRVGRSGYAIAWLRVRG